MKKFFAIAALFAVAAFSFTSCGGDEDTAKVRIKTYAYTEEKNGVPEDWADVWTYNYDEAGKLINITRGENDRTWDFTYSGNTVTIKYVKEGQDKGNIVMTLDAKGNCTKYVDEYGDEFNYTYDENGYIIQVKKFNDLKSDVVIENGNIKQWSKIEGETTYQKLHTYGAAKNVNNIRNIYAEFGAPRFMREAGFFGKGTAMLCTTNQWDYSQDPSQLDYEYDKDGNIAAEKKSFPTKENSKTEVNKYTWESIK